MEQRDSEENKMSFAKLRKEWKTPSMLSGQEIEVMAKLYWLKAAYEDARKKYFMANQAYGKFMDSQLRRFSAKEPKTRKGVRALRKLIRRRTRLPIAAS
jgi:hypothetical protein